LRLDLVDGYQRPIEAEPSKHENHSSSGFSVSEPDYFGSMEKKESSLLTVANPVDSRSFIR